jgi:hypothetical protein
MINNPRFIHSTGPQNEALWTIPKAITHLKGGFWFVRKLCTFKVKLVSQAITILIIDKPHIANKIMFT